MAPESCFWSLPMPRSIISLTTVGHVDIIRERDIEAWELAFGIALSILAMIFYTCDLPLISH